MALLYVSKSGNDFNDGLSAGNAFLTISAALVAAQDGDTVIVGDGTYDENIIISEAITLLSENGSASTFIRGSLGGGGNGTVNFASGVTGAVLGDVGQGFTITGYDSPNHAVEEAAIFFLGTASDITIRGNEIVADGELAIGSIYASPVDQLTIDQNTITGITFDNSAPLPDFGTISSAQFGMNTPRPAVYFGNTNKTNIEFSDNLVTIITGGVDVDGDYRGNTQVVLDGSTNIATGNTFNGENRGDGDVDFAPALRMNGSGHTITDNTFSLDKAGGFSTNNAGTTISGNELNGGAGDDGIVDGPGNSIVNGGDGDDTILAGAGNDTVDGGGGTDTYDMTNAGSGGSFVDLQSGLAFSSNTGIDTLVSIENIRGSAGGDGLYGNANANVFFATAGADVIDGRGGSDSFDASNAATAVTIDLGAGTVTGAFTASLTSIENAVGGTGNDQFFGSSASNTFHGNAGTDTFSNLGDGDVVDGGSESDTAVFSANFGDAVITTGAAGTYTVTIGGATVTLTGVEQLQFADALVHVVGAEAGVSDYQSIQEAVDIAAPDDIVFVLNGTYEEQIVISKNLTLTGEGDSTIIRAPDGTITALSGRASIITVNSGANVTIQDLQVDGEGRGNELGGGAGDFHGIAYINAGGTVEDVTVTGIRMPLDGNGHVSGIQQGRAIYANNTDPTEYTLNVIGNTVTDYQKNGIDLRGNLQVNVTGNEITGNGWTPTTAQNGIVVVGGVEGTISDNTVSEVGYVDTPANSPATSAGVLNFNSDVTISDNTITAPSGIIDAPGEGSASGAYSYSDGNGSTITGNTISGFPVAIVSEADGESPTVTGNILTNNDVNLRTFDATAPVSIGGTEGRDEIAGGAFDDTLEGGAGNDLIDGGDGVDTIDFTGTHSAGATFDWNESDGVFTVTTASGGTDQVTNVERVEFDDIVVWLVTDSAGLTAALANAGSDDVIKLAPGDYSGNFSIATEGLTIESVTGNAEDVVFTGTFRTLNPTITGSETVGDFLEGKAGHSGGGGNGFTISADNVTLRNITIAEYTNGIQLASNDELTIDGVVLDGNVIGIYKEDGAAEVTNFEMLGGGIKNGYQGIIINAAVGAGSFDGVTINGTSFENLTWKGAYFEQLTNAQLIDLIMNDVGQYGRSQFSGGTPGSDGSGIELNLKYGDYENISITGFDLTDVGLSNGGGSPHANGGAIAIKTRDDAPSYNTNDATLDGVTIADGSINGTSTGIRFGEPGKVNNGPTNVTVENVTIDNASVGSYDNRTSVILEVELTGGNDVATTNPSATGPIHFQGGDGDDSLKGGGGVDQSLYTTSIDAKAGITFDEGTDTWTISAGAEGTDTLKDIEIVDGLEAGRILLVGGGGFPTLQDAVNAAQDGDIILLASGQFVGDVTIANKELTILGVNNDGIDGNGTRGTESSIVGRVTLTGSKEVTFDGVEFRATATTGTTGPSNGALNLKGSGTYLVQNSVFFNETQGGNNESRAIMIDSSFVGMATISDNLITGAFPNNFSTASWQRGIWSDGNAAELNITGNTFQYTRSAINLDGYDDATHEVSGNLFEEAGSGISIGIPKTNTFAGIHDNDFQLVSGMVGGVPQGETSFNFQNVTAPVVLDLSATNNESSTGNIILVRGGTNADDITGSDGADILVGNAGADELDGGGGNDVILGGAGDDTITGGDGDDIIDGGDDNDTIIAGGGSDTVEGGNGTDKYVLSGDFSDYTITYDSGTQTYSVTDGSETTTVRGVENFQFGTTVVDVTGNPDVIVTDAAPLVTDVIEQGIDEDADANTIEVPENATVGTLLARINGTDVNLGAGDSLSYTLVDDLDQPYVGPFTLTQADNGTAFLFLTGALDFETASSHALRVRITDSTGNSVTEDFTIGVLNVNEAPTAIQLSSQTVSENDEGANVAIITVDDQDDNVTLVEVSDARFEVVNVLGTFVLRLKAGESLNHETEPQINLTVTATDAGGLSKAQSFTIAVQNVNESPGGAGGLQQEVELEQGSTRFPLGLAQIVDPEGDTLTYTVSALPAQGTVFNGNTVLVGGSVLTAAQLEALTYTASNTSDADQVLEFIVSDGILSDTLQVNIQVDPAESKTYTGTAGADRLDGAAGDDTILGLAGNDILIGGVGNDLLDGGSEADEMHGGAGNDTYEVDNIGDQVFEDEDNGYDTVNASITYTLGQHVEKLVLTGTDNTNGTGNGLGNHIVGNSGNNIIDGGVGGDLMEGGAGDDTYQVDNAGDQVSEAKNQGFDTVNSSVSFNLNGQWIEKLVLTGSTNINGKGNSLDNVLIGNSGNNTLNGDTGADIMEGGAGNDTYRVDNAGDVAVETKNNGYDVVSSSVTYNLGGQHVEELRLLGSDNLKAKGNSLDNVIIGNSGNNRIDGDRGNDTLTGGAGVDTFIFKTTLDAVANVDTITDFSVIDDTIELHQSTFTALSAGTLSANAFHIGAAAADASDRIIYNNATGGLFYDSDGVGGNAAIQFATIGVGLALNQNDFVIV